MLLYYQKKNTNQLQQPKSSKRGGGNGNGNGIGNRLLIKVNVIGSPGPLRILVNDEELVISVIDTVLKSYAREGRLPLLDTDINNFLLYCSNTESHALRPWDKIGSHGVRNFVLHKKPEGMRTTTTTRTKTISRHNWKRSGNWKSWLNRKCLVY